MLKSGLALSVQTKDKHYRFTKGLCPIPVQSKVICYLPFSISPEKFSRRNRKATTDKQLYMLSLLKIKNVALIDELQLEFHSGLNLLTGETGSGKSIIVDSLGALTGARLSADIIKEGETTARIEGVFEIPRQPKFVEAFEEAGIEFDEAETLEIIVRRELSATGKNRVFVNNQTVTQQFLKKIGEFLAEIHGQGEQQKLFEPATHLEIFDEFADALKLRAETGEHFRAWQKVKKELDELRTNETNKLQMADVLRFQLEEIAKAALKNGEDEELELERKRLANVEKLSALSAESYALLYENNEAVIAQLAQVTRKNDELAKYESRFAEYDEGLKSAQAVLEDLAFTLRDFADSLEFSPNRLSEIENRLAEISRLKRKYGGSLETILAFYDEAKTKLDNIENADERAAALEAETRRLRKIYVESAQKLHDKRAKTAPKFEKEMENALGEVALEKSRFVVKIDAPKTDELNDENFDKPFTRKGFDALEFYFSANIGESPRPLAKVASGGEASRLMLVLKTIAKRAEAEKTAVFDEIDTGISGRVSEAVGRKLKDLSGSFQVLCVTHQPQVASLADSHYRVLKETNSAKTIVKVIELDEKERVEEVARMLTGAKVTETARRHAKEMISGV